MTYRSNFPLGSRVELAAVCLACRVKRQGPPCCGAIERGGISAGNQGKSEAQAVLHCKQANTMTYLSRSGDLPQPLDAGVGGCQRVADRKSNKAVRTCRRRPPRLARWTTNDLRSELSQDRRMRLDGSSLTDRARRFGLWNCGVAPGDHAPGLQLGRTDPPRDGFLRA